MKCFRCQVKTDHFWKDNLCSVVGLALYSTSLSCQPFYLFVWHFTGHCLPLSVVWQLTGLHLSFWGVSINKTYASHRAEVGWSCECSFLDELLEKYLNFVKWYCPSAISLWKQQQYFLKPRISINKKSSCQLGKGIFKYSGPGINPRHKFFLESTLSMQQIQPLYLCPN